MEPAANPNYVLRERKNGSENEIPISYFNTDTYVNVENNKRPCYENLDKPISLERLDPES